MRKILALAGALAAGLPASGAIAAGRYAYVLGCDARIDKLDTVVDRKIESVDLASRTGRGAALIPKVEGGLDGCLAYTAVYDPSRSRFYTIVPLQARSKPDGTKDYRALAFSVPGLWLRGKERKTMSTADPARLRLKRGRLVSADQVPPRTDVELGNFEPEKSAIPNQILETSGDIALLRLFTANRDELVLAVANLRAKTLGRLNSLPPTTALNVHLAPGGRAVLVEEVTVSGSTATKSGRLILYDSASGNSVSTFNEPDTKGLAFIAIAPDGHAICRSSETYRLVDLGRTFTDTPVTRPFSLALPAFFFADR
jgi:hypothetical protein